MDYFPALMGKLNPITGILLYFTGFVLIESQRANNISAVFQWMFLILLPVHAVLAAIKFWWFKRGLRKRGEDVTAARSQWLQLQRSAYLDFHFCAQILVPAGMSGHERADLWLFLVPIFMLLRFLWSINWPPLARVCFWINRVGTFVVLIPSMLVLLGYAFKGVMSSLVSLHAAGFWGIFMLPITLGLTYVMYIAPASLIPAAIGKVWRGDRRAAAVSAAPPAVELSPEEKAKQKRERIGWIVAYVIATILTSITGNDVPFFLLMFMQIFRQSPDKLMQILIDKGDWNTKRKRSSEAKLFERLDDRTEWIRAWRAKQARTRREARASEAKLYDRLKDRSEWISAWRAKQAQGAKEAAEPAKAAE